MGNVAKHRTTGRAVAGAIAFLLYPALAYAQLAVPIDIPWSNSRPQRLELIGSGPSVPLPYDSESGHFAGRYPRNASTPAFDNLNLVGWWNNQEDRLLHLRIYPDTVRLNLRLWRPVYRECRRELITPLNAITDDRDTALESYYRAKALYELATDNRCIGARREAVALAWFNRSFELMRLDCSFRLSPAAIRAYREFDSAYVDRYVRQARGREIQCINNTKLQLLRQGNLRGAYSISLALVSALRNDAALRRLVLEEQQLSLGMLEQEHARIEGRLGRGGRPTLILGAQSEMPHSDRRLYERQYYRQNDYRQNADLRRYYGPQPDRIVPAQLNLMDPDAD